MLIYLVIFASSSFLLYESERISNRTLKRLALYLGLLLPALLAGLRAQTIGTDVRVYGKIAYEQAIGNSFNDYIVLRATSGLSDIGFYTLTYFLAQVLHDYHWGLFVYSLICQIFIYKGFKQCSQRFGTVVWFGMILYYFGLYNYSLNIMRQTIAVAIVFYASVQLFEEKYGKYLFWCVIAVLFHSSALVGFAFLPMHRLLRQGRNISFSKKLFQGIMFIGLLIIVINLIGRLLQWGVDIGILRANYLSYLSGGQFNNTQIGLRSISIFSYLPHLLFIILIIVNYKRLEKRNQEVLFFFMISIVVLITDFAPLYASYTERIGFYFVTFLYVILNNIRFCFENKSKKIWELILIVIFFIIWYRNIISLNYGETVPFMFYWQ